MAHLITTRNYTSDYRRFDKTRCLYIPICGWRHEPSLLVW